MADYTQIIQEINTNLPDNNTQSITAAKLRTTLTDMLGAIDDVQQEFEGDVNETLSTFVEDTLYSTDTDKALSANQGYNLAATRNKLIVEGNDGTLIRQSRTPVQPGHKYRLTLSTTELTMNNISLGSGYTRLYVFASTSRSLSEGGTATTLISIPITGELSKEYEFTIPEATDETSYEWLEIQSRFDSGQRLVYFLEDITTIEELDNKINPKTIVINKKGITNYTQEYSNKFAVCQYQGSSSSQPAYYGLLKYYALGKSFTSLLESGTNTSHKIYRIPVDPENYVIVSCNFYGSNTATASAPLACLVDENDIVVGCVTNNLGNGGYWTGTIIPKTAKYLMMPYWAVDSYVVNLSFIPKSNFVSQNEEVTFSLPGNSSNMSISSFSKEAPMFIGGANPDTYIIYGRNGNAGKYTVDDLSSTYFGSGTKYYFKLFYVEGYDEVEFTPFTTTAYAGLFFVADRNGNIIDAINSTSVTTKYQLPSNACFFLYRGWGTNTTRTLTLRKKSVKPLTLPVMPHEGIGLTPGKLSNNGELRILQDKEIYWTTSFIDLSRGFTLTLNPEFRIVKGVLYNTDGTVANPFFFDETDSNAGFYSIANPIPGYLLRLTVSPDSESSSSEPITKYDSVIKNFTYLDNKDLTKVIPENLPYEDFQKRVYKLTNISEIARYDQWMNHYDNWNNNDQSIPMTSNEGEGLYWNTRFREGWTEYGTPYSETSEYNYYIGQNISLKTFVTAVQNKRSVLYSERINTSIVNNSTIGSNKSKYGYTYRGLNSHYAATFYGTVCTGLTGYLMGQNNVYVSGDYMRRNADNTGPRVPNLTAQYSKYYADTITQSQWDEMIDWLQPMDFIWTPGHCSSVSDIYKDKFGKTQYIVWTEEVRPFTKSRAYTREQFQQRLQNILNQGSGNGFGLLRYTGWDNADLSDYYNDNDYFSINNYTLKSNIKIDPDITTFRGEYVTFQIGDSTDSLNDFKAFLNIHRGVNKYNYLQIYYEDDTEMTTALKQIGISASELYPSDTLYPEDAYDQEDWIIFDLTDAEKMDGVLDAGRYKARLYNSNDGTYSGFSHFEFVDYTFSASLDGSSIKCSWSNFSENATPYLIRQERSTGMGLTEGSEYPSNATNRKGQTYVYNITNSSATNEVVYTLTTDHSWGTAEYTKIIVRGTYGCVSRRIKTIN